MSRALIKTCERLRYTPNLRHEICRSFSILQKPPPNYPGHVPLTFFERTGLAVGSAIASMVNHYRHDMIAALGESTAQPYFVHRLRRAMLSSPTGRRILRDKPRMNSSTLNIPYLRTLPKNTLGYEYVSWLDREGVSADTRAEVRYIDDPEEAYVMQRYREVHDFLHALTGLPIVAEGEIALKAFEFANTLLPMTGISLAAIIRLKKEERERFWGCYGPWAVRNGLKAEEMVCVYWEEELETDVDVLRKRLGVEKPPDLRKWRKNVRMERKRIREMNEGKEGMTKT